MGKHEAPGRNHRQVTLILRQVEKVMVAHFRHFVLICVHTTVAVIVVEKTPLLLMLGLIH